MQQIAENNIKINMTYIYYVCVYVHMYVCMFVYMQHYRDCSVAIPHISGTDVFIRSD